LERTLFQWRLALEEVQPPEPLQRFGQSRSLEQPQPSPQVERQPLPLTPFPPAGPARRPDQSPESALQPM
jgi:hypothetical protein